MSKVIISKLVEKEMVDLGVKTWPIWEKEVSRFDWTYTEDEQCYIIEGEFVVTTGENSYHIVPGDFVTFRKGLTCVWEINKPVKKYYNFL